MVKEKQHEAEEVLWRDKERNYKEEIQKYKEEMEFDEEFRLFLTCEAHNEFPVSLLISYQYVLRKAGFIFLI